MECLISEFCIDYHTKWMAPSLETKSHKRNLPTKARITVSNGAAGNLTDTFISSMLSKSTRKRKKRNRFRVIHLFNNYLEPLLFLQSPSIKHKQLTVISQSEIFFVFFPLKNLHYFFVLVIKNEAIVFYLA